MMNVLTTALHASTALRMNAILNYVLTAVIVTLDASVMMKNALRAIAPLMPTAVDAKAVLIFIV